MKKLLSKVAVALAPVAITALRVLFAETLTETERAVRTVVHHFAQEYIRRYERNASWQH